MTPNMDDFVAKIVTDPKNPPNTLLLKGYIGASSEDGHIRLYLDSELSDYVEIPEAAILYSQEIPKEKSPIGGSYIWIQRDATVIHGPAAPDRAKASFLQGRITANQADVLPLPQPSQTITGPRCGTIIDGCTDFGPKCPTSVGRTCPDPCTSVGVFCNTQSGSSCQTRSGCTQSGPSCQTNQDPACTTANGPNCRTSSLFSTCSGPSCATTPEATCCGPQCPTFPASTNCGPNCPTVSGNATCPAPACTQSGPNCQTASGNSTCPAPTCTHIGPTCQTLIGQAGCTSAGIHCPTASGHHTCPGPTCTQSGPLCQTKNSPDCPFPTEAGKTCVGPCHQP